MQSYSISLYINTSYCNQILYELEKGQHSEYNIIYIIKREPIGQLRRWGWGEHKHGTKTKISGLELCKWGTNKS